MNVWVVLLVGAWVAIAAIVVLQLSMLRQLGLVMMRINPSGAFDLANEGPETGTVARLPAAPDGTAPAADVDGLEVVVFVSPGCGACDRLLPGLRTFQSAYGGVRVLVTGDEWMAERVREEKLTGLRAEWDRGLGEKWNVRNTPYAVGVDSTGHVAAKGIVNTLDHLEEFRARMYVTEQRNQQEDLGSNTTGLEIGG